jgi:hypothetical protein
VVKLELKYEVQPFIEKLYQTRDILADLRWLWDEVSHPWWLAQVEKNFATHGVHSRQDWSLAPKYRAYKSSLRGVLVDPLRWAPGREQVYPSTTDASHPMHVWEARPDGYTIASLAPNLPSLRSGGVGPFGEAFSPADPFGTTQEQLDDLATLESQGLKAKLRELGLEVA